MPSPAGTTADLNVIQKKIGQVKHLIQQNKMTEAKALMTTIVSNLGTVNTAVQAATKSNDLSADPTLDIDVYAVS